MKDGATPRALDVICIGRAAVDLYGEQIGARLEDVTTFARYLGGSPANTAVGCARLGLRAAMLTRVGDEQNGRFVLDSLAARRGRCQPCAARSAAADRARVPQHSKPHRISAAVLSRSLRRYGARSKRCRSTIYRQRGFGADLRHPFVAAGNLRRVPSSD